MVALILTLAMIGDGGVVGAVGGYLPGAYLKPDRALEQALAAIPEDRSVFSGATVANQGVSKSVACDWAFGPYSKCPPISGYCPANGTCQSRKGPLVQRACADGTSLGEALIPTLGYTPDYVLMTIGVLDALYGHTNASVAACLAQVAINVAPATLIISPPYPVDDSNPTLKAAVESLTSYELSHGISTGPIWPLFPGSGNEHLDHGSYVAVAGYWEDLLLSMPQ